MEKIEWMAPEYIHTEKTSDWYWIVGIISITIALTSIILNNIIFAVLILVSGFTLSLFSSRKPDLVEMEINNQGIHTGKRFYHYENISSFNIENNDNFPRIILKTKSYISPAIKILIHREEAEEINQFLQKHLPKENLSESIFEKLLIYFGV